MTRYAAFLRGVNVGGVNLKMAEVAKAFEDAGFDGTCERFWPAAMCCSNPLTAAVATVRKKAEAALRDSFGYDAWVLAYDIETGRAPYHEAYPFEREVDGYQSYVTFVTDAKVLDELASLETHARSQGEDRTAAKASSTGRCPQKAAP